MKRYVILSAALAAGVMLWASMAFAEDDNGQNQSGGVAIQPGMEAKKVTNDVTVLVPKGGKVFKTNQGTYVLESPEEYAARKFEGVYKRLDALEEENRSLKKELARIRARIDEPKKTVAVSRENEPAENEE